MHDSAGNGGFPIGGGGPRVARFVVLGVGVVILALLSGALLDTFMAGSGEPDVHAQNSGKWVLSSTKLNPAGDDDPVNWVVSPSETSMSVTQSFGPDDPSGAEAQFDATWKAPPSELEPDTAMEISVTVSGRVTGSRETQFFFGLDVIMLVDGTWNNSAVGAGANCAQTTVISNEYVCSDPVTNTGVLPFRVPAFGETFTVGVGALNCGGVCYVEWSYDWVEAPVAVDDAIVDDAIVDDAIVDDAVVPTDVGTEEEVAPPDSGSTPTDPFAGGDGSGGALPVLVIGAAAAAAVAGGVAIQRGRGGKPDSTRSDTQDDEERTHSVSLQLTYPVGPSPCVLQYGWVFGARCIVDAGTPEERDVSDSVRWSGPATFHPSVGRRSSPAFKNGSGWDRDIGEGESIAASITLTVDVDGITRSRTFPVRVISTFGYVRLGDISKVAADGHGCPACPHTCKGPIVAGNASGVMLAGLPVATVGDPGVHAACCGSNTYVIATGDQRVLINGKPAAWQHSVVTHCGGTGYMSVWHPGGG